MPPKRTHELAKTPKQRVHSRVFSMYSGDHEPRIEQRLATLAPPRIGDGLAGLHVLDEERARARRQPAVQLRAVDEILPIDIQSLHNPLWPNASPSMIEYAYPCSQRNSCRLSAKSC